MSRKSSNNDVHGLVSSLFDVVDDRFMIAIESAAGGKLFNVVIDTDETTKELIKSGSLKKRITFISLNRVNPKKIDQKIMKLASSLVGDNKCWLASELVTCDKNVRVAIDFVLGNTIICESSKEAKILAYDKRVGFRCVTLDGDVFESTGVLTGGSRPTQNSLLQKQKEFRSYKINLEELTEKDFEIENYLSKNNATYNSYTNLVKKIEEKRIELELIQSKLKTSDRFQLQENISEIKNLVAECLNEEGQYKKEIALETKTHNELEEKSKNEAAFRAETVKKLEQNIQKIKQKLDLVLKKIAESEPMIFDLENQNEELQQEKGKQINQLKSISASINDFSDKIQEYETRMNKTKGELARLEKELEIIKQQIAEHNHHIQSLNSKRSQFNKELFEIELKKKEIDSNISNLKQTIHQTSVHINETLTQNNWIESEEKNFNNPGSVYNFSNINYKELKDRLDWLENSVKKLQRVVNTRAMNMLSQAEEKFNDLLKKKKIVENDRNKIENMIKDLDIKKNESLKISSRKVNSDFGSIFSTLLPGANAKLCLIENKNKLEGLEIKVGFGNSWKESLSELSGGQRSLVALSLILSLLLFKPAPIYILDEIDAALDISHTQNIGVMLRSHFRQSQFIIVSLKDGLFSNANVLFKTKFINGISNISRHVQDHRKQKENIPPEFINAGSN